MSTERSGAITMKGNPMTLVGPELKASVSAHDSSAIAQGLEAANLASSAGKVRLFSAVPSLDTPVCSVQTKRFAEEVANLPDSVRLV